MLELATLPSSTWLYVHFHLSVSSPSFLIFFLLLSSFIFSFLSSSSPIFSLPTFLHPSSPIFSFLISFSPSSPCPPSSQFLFLLLNMSVCSKQTLKWPRKEGRERCVLVSIQLTCKFQVTTSLRSYEPFFYFGKPEFTSKQLCVHGIWPSLWGHSSTSVGFPVYLGSTTKCLTKTLTTASFKVVFVFCFLNYLVSVADTFSSLMFGHLVLSSLWSAAGETFRGHL